MRLIGLDPGLRLTGWGVIDVDGNRLRHVAHGVIKVSIEGSLAARLHELFEAIAATPSNSSRKRSANGAAAATRTTPCATWRSLLPSISITPQPVRRRPGSRPISLIAL